MSSVANMKGKNLLNLKEKLKKEGIIFKKRIPNYQSYINNFKNTSLNKIKKNISIIPESTIKTADTFRENYISTDSTNQKKLFYIKHDNNLTTTDFPMTYRKNEKINLGINSINQINKIRYHKKLKSDPKIIFNLKYNENYYRHLSPRLNISNYKDNKISNNYLHNISQINALTNKEKEKKYKLSNKKYNKIIINTDKGKENYNINNTKNKIYNKQISNLSLNKNNKNDNKKQVISGNNRISKNVLKKFYGLSLNKSQFIGNNITTSIYNNKKNNQSKISLKYNIGNYNLKNKFLTKLIRPRKSEDFEMNEIKIKNSKLIDYMNKSNTNISGDNLDFITNNSSTLNYNKYKNRRRNFSNNFFSCYNNDFINNDDSFMNKNNISFTLNKSFSSNNKLNNKNQYFELAKICENQEKIISDLVKNVKQLNNQICDKDLQINELNNQLYSIKYDLLNTLQKTDRKTEK